jgi:hypothetical protein
MAQNVAAQLKRPLPLALAAAAVLGWILVIVLLVSRSSLESDLTARIEESEAARAAFATQLREQQQAAGTLEEIRSATAALEAQLAELNARREQA